MALTKLITITQSVINIYVCVWRKKGFNSIGNIICYQIRLLTFSCLKRVKILISRNVR